jgi:hypothetical protein
MEGDERGFRVALVAAELVNPPPGGLDALAVLEAEGWGVVQLPAAWYPDDVAAPLLEHVAEQVDEFARHGYDVVLVGERAGLDAALGALGHERPPALPAPQSPAELAAFLQSRRTVAPRSAAS